LVRSLFQQDQDLGVQRAPVGLGQHAETGVQGVGHPYL